ncbi:hypothetical protein [Streptomyces sp. NPDC006739]|uniref:hypothetical protein n=1 Tax=Streptomyces sp. NPDC006739 TaxID=3364763 RepID=UPI0036C3D7AB
MGAESVPRREVVTGEPRPARGAEAPHLPGTGSPPADDDTTLRKLMRRQLRAALTATALLVLALGLLPVVFRLPPLTGTLPRAPIAVWIVLGVAPYPALMGIGRWYVRRAERNETEFAAHRAGPGAGR